MRPLRKYGPLAAILVAVGVLAVLVALNDPVTTGDDATASATGAPSPTVGAPAPTGRMPLTLAEAEEQDAADDADWGDRCDRSTRRVKLPTLAAMPCVPVFTAPDNGGATGPGVSADSVRIVFYSPNPEGDLLSLLDSVNANDTPEQRVATVRAYLDIYSSRAELYGREIELVEFAGTGAADDVIAARSDAREIIADLDPLLVLGGPTLDRGTFATELARNGVMCFDCGAAIPDSMVQANPGMIWGPLPSTDQYLQTLYSWIDPDGTAGGDAPDIQLAEFAGDERFRDRPRRTGIIHFDQDPPLFDTVGEANEARDASVVDRQTYLLDFATMPEKAAELVAKFKAQEITTVVFLGDPIMPGFLTAAATDQEYFPEWIFTGTALTDTNLFGRTYDQRQMAHAFGISQLQAPSVQAEQIDVRLYRWWTGDPDSLPPAEGQYSLMASRARFVVNGIHMAGPDLTAATFRDGLFRLPPSRSGVSMPQVSYGNWGYFDTTDYQGVDDSVEIWWDPSVRAEDEIGTVGDGVWRRAHGGRRFVGEGDSPAPEPNPFDPDDTVTVLERIPDDERPPQYEPPPEAPASQ